MAQCISPYYSHQHHMEFPCGKCYPCKMRRIQGWSFRLQQEAERSDSALFVTLTYDNDHVPITTNKFMTLKKRDVQLFIKRLRNITWLHSKDPLRKPIKYYAAGEYGDKFKRPHYHLIIFNAEHEFIEKSWLLGEIHYGDLTPASAAYTAKYISKDGIVGKFEKDDRQKEFSLMSKRLGDNYLTPQMIHWHRQRSKGSPIPDRYNLLVPGGYKIAIPRYFKDRIWNVAERQLIGQQFIKYKYTQDGKKTPYEQLEDWQKNEYMREYYARINYDARDTTI